MDKIKDLYQDDLIYIFTGSQLRDLNTDYLAIIKNECSIQTINNCITMHYQDDFESLLAFSPLIVIPLSSPRLTFIL